MNEKQALPDRELLTEKEAAEYLRISRITLWRERQKGNISFRRAGSKLLYDRDEDLNAYLNRSKRAAFAAA
jgi:excisionase family DNA binding protein